VIRRTVCISVEGTLFFVVIPIQAVGQQIVSAESCSDLEGKLVVYKMTVFSKIIES